MLLKKFTHRDRGESLDGSEEKVKAPQKHREKKMTSMVDPAFMMAQLREMKQELGEVHASGDHSLDQMEQRGQTESDKTSQRLDVSWADPFMMLKEVVEMSKYMNTAEIKGSQNQSTEFQMKCEENVANYKAMVQNNFDKLVTSGDEQTKALADKYNLSAL